MSKKGKPKGQSLESVTQSSDLKDSTVSVPSPLDLRAACVEWGVPVYVGGEEVSPPKCPQMISGKECSLYVTFSIQNLTKQRTIPG